MTPRFRKYVRCVVLSVFVSLMALAITAQAGFSQGVDSDSSETANSQVAYGKLPLSFIQNDGQVDKKVKFYEKGSGHATFFAKDAIYLTFAKGPSASAAATPDSTLIKLMPLDANAHPKIVAEGLQEGKVNYFIGNNPKKWKTNIPTYQAVIYQDVYPGIDMKFYGNNRQMEYDIIVKPGADPSKVTLSYEGIEGLQLTDAGDMMISIKGATLRQNKPVIYQEIDGKRVDVTGAFKIRRADRHAKSFSYAFKVASYDTTQPLVIDPVIVFPTLLVYSTYLGGSSGDQARGITVDSAGNAYVTGETSSINFPTLNPIQGSGGGALGDIFVTKINAAGTALVYSTFLGGSSLDAAFSIKVDSSGNAYVTGNTTSADFPTVNALQPTFHGPTLGTGDAYVVKLDPTGATLVYSTYLGGSANEQAHSVAVDSGGNAYVTGITSSVCIDSTEFCFPTTAIPPNPFGPSSFSSFFIGGTSDGFLTKIDAAGGLVYSGYLGTVDRENPWGVAVDAAGAAYVVMQWTKTTDVIGTDTDDNEDVLVFKINPGGPLPGYPGPSGGTIISFGGSGDDIPFYIALDGSGNVYITGSTTSTNLLHNSVNAIQATFGGGTADAFVAKISEGPPDNTGQTAHIVYLTYLGGNGFDSGHGIAVDSSGNAYVAGNTKSENFPTVNPIQAAIAGGQDAFVAKINAAGTALVRSTYLGGSGDEAVAVGFGGVGLALDSSGNAYITGRTNSTNFPTVNPIQAAYGGGSSDAFVAKIGLSNPQDLLNDLMAVVNETIATNNSQGIANSLDAKLESARDALDAAKANSMATARNKLDAFVNETQAQSGKKITVNQATQLIDSANSIKAYLVSP